MGSILGSPYFGKLPSQTFEDAASPQVVGLPAQSTMAVISGKLNKSANLPDLAINSQQRKIQVAMALGV